jgi:PAS domain S-box-containing protein
MPSDKSKRSASLATRRAKSRAHMRAAGLQEIDELYGLLVASVTDYAIFVLDDQGVIRSWNPGAQRLKGYTEDEIVGKHFSIFYPPEDVDKGKPDRELKIASTDGRVEDEGWRVRKDGTRFWANVVITALRNEQGDLQGFAKITRDLTERRKGEEQARQLAAESAARSEAELHNEQLTQLSEELQQQAVELESQTEEAQSLTEELEQTNEQLQRQMAEASAARAAAEAANRAKTEFLAVMSHELRTPLNAIAGYTELLQMGLRGPVTAEQVEDLSRISRSERTLLSLINDILNFARLEAGHVSYTSEPVDILHIVTDLEAMISPQLRAKELRFGFTGCDSGLAVRADPDKVRQILLNLLSNAIKFTPASGSIEITCAADAKGVEIRVSDTGVGIPAEKRQAIFEPFVQLDRSLTSTQEGSGLGLAISRDLARAMGGDLSAEQNGECGSTFLLTLPRAGRS